MIYLIVALLTLPAKTIEVQNGLTPQGTAYTLVLEEDLIVGDEPDASFAWFDSQTHAIPDEQGNFYVVVPDESTVYFFNAKGDLVRQFGGEGQGPGEFNGLRTFQILKDGTARAFAHSGGSYSLTTYDKKGEVVNKSNSVVPNSLVKSMHFSPNGKFVFVNMRQRRNQERFHMQAMLDKRYTPKKVLVEIKDPPRDPPDFGNPEFWTKLIASGLSNSWKDFGMADYASDGSVYLARASEYAIEKWDANMKTKLLVIRKESKPIPFDDAKKEKMLESMHDSIYRQTPNQYRQMITPALVRKALEKSNPPKAMNPIRSLIALDDKGFIVVTKSDREASQMSADLFDQKGTFLGQLDFNHLELLKMRFKNGFGYGMREIDDQYYAVRYRYSLKPKP